jgi:hypothetical protein
VPENRPLAQRVLSWLIAALGLGIGLLALSRTGAAWIPSPSTDTHWPRLSAGIAGGFLLGLTFLSGSIVATRDRRRGGMIFLVCAPVVAFCLAFSSAGYLQWEANSDGVFYSPILSIALILSLLFFAPFVLPPLVSRDRHRTFYLFLVMASLVSPVLVYSRWSRSLLPFLAGWSALFAIFGFFWLGTHRLGCAPLVSSRRRATGERVMSFAAGCVVVLCLDLAITFGLAAMTSSLFTGDCRGKAPFVHSQSPSHAVCTARVIFVGRSFEALVDAGFFRRIEVRDRQVGDWAVGIVEQRFWGVPTWSRLVLLTNDIYWKSESYFIDGNRPHGILTRFLPIIEGDPNCSRTRPEADADIDLRLLHQGSVANGVRIIGYVSESQPPWQPWMPPKPRNALAGAKINVRGSSWTGTATADKEGIYEIDDLPPDDYSLTLALPDMQVASEQKVTKEEMIRHKFIEADFEVHGIKN